MCMSYFNVAERMGFWGFEFISFYLLVFIIFFMWETGFSGYLCR